MAVIKIQSGNVTDLITSEIEDILTNYEIDLLKDRKKQADFEKALNQELSFGKWTARVVGNSITITLSKGAKRVIWRF